MRSWTIVFALLPFFVSPHAGHADEPVAADPAAPSDAEAAKRWCAPELVTLSADVCAFIPDKPIQGPKTLIIHLHGVIHPDTPSQWNQQRQMAKVGAKYGFSVIMPRGRRGIGPTTMEHWWAWPTSIDTRSRHEKNIVTEWVTAKGELEKKAGAPFERTYVFGFSNGAYYATSLAMRGRIEADGYALFAGGSGAPYHEYEAKKTKKRAPIAVAWGAGDPSHEKQEDLIKLLKRMRWPSISLGHPRAGHAMTDKQIEEALGFLRATKDSQ